MDGLMMLVSWLLVVNVIVLVHLGYESIKAKKDLTKAINKMLEDSYGKEVS